MGLRTFHVEHYKSLNDITLDFADDVTVIVGPNGVGKSNFVDALQFLRDAAGENLERAIAQREGIGRILQTYKTKPYQIAMRCDMNDDSTYAMKLKADGAAGYAVVSEERSVSSNLPQQTKSTSSLGRAINYLIYQGTSSESDVFSRRANGDVNSPAFKGAQTLPNDELALGKRMLDLRGQLGHRLMRQLRAWSHFTISPDLMRKPLGHSKETSLLPTGENWATVIKDLKKRPSGRVTLTRIYDAMQAVMPSFQEVTVKAVGSYLVPSFQFKVKGISKPVGYDPVQLSDGTLRLFGILLAAYQPRPADGLIIIEEPEQTIYPGALTLLADVFKEVGKSTQILITTHSPHLVQQFSPHQIRVATLENGMTKIRPIHPHQKRAVEEGLIGLGEFMMNEGLQADDTEASEQ